MNHIKQDNDLLSQLMACFMDFTARTAINRYVIKCLNVPIKG